MGRIEKYTNNKYGFTVNCPQGWIINTKNLPSDILVEFYDPTCKENNINIVSGTIYWKRSIEELEDILKLNVLALEGKIISIKHRMMDDSKAVEGIYKVQGWTHKKVGFEKESYEYIFTCRTRTENFLEYDPIFDECIQSFKFERIIDNAEEHYFLGVSYEKNRLYKDAEKEYLKTIEINPEYYKAYCNLGTICNRTGRKEDAIKYYKKALQINSKDPITLFNLGIIYNIDGDIDEGFDYLCKAIAADPSIEPKVHGAIKFYSYHPKEDIQRLNRLLINHYEEILQRNPNDSDTHYNLGCVYYTTADNEKALHHFCKAIYIGDLIFKVKVNQIINVHSLNPERDFQKLNDLLKRGCH